MSLVNNKKNGDIIDTIINEIYAPSIANVLLNPTKPSFAALQYKKQNYYLKFVEWPRLVSKKGHVFSKAIETGTILFIDQL